MPSIYRQRLRRRSATALASALLLTACVSINVGAAQSEAGEQRQKLEHLRDVNADARRDAGRLRREIDELQGEAVDRGVLVTLDDTLFTTNDATLSRSGHYRLNALAGFLESYPERAVAIDGYAGVGGYRYDLALVKRRAEAIEAHLIRQGIAPSRLSVRGNGAALPDDVSGPARQLHRRVEVIIEDPSSPVSQPDATASAPRT